MFILLKKLAIQGKTFVKFCSLTFLGRFLGMLLPLLFAKFVSPEIFGSYSLAKMIIFFFIAVLISSSQTPFIVYANEEIVKTGKIQYSFSSQLIFLFFSLIFFSFALLVFGIHLSNFADISMNELFFVFLAFLGIAFKGFFAGLLLALNERIKNSLMEVIFSLFSIFLFLSFWFLGRIDLSMFFLIYFLSSIFTIFIFIFFINFKLLLPLKFDRKHFKKMFDFVKWQIIGLSAVYFINWGDNFVLRYFVDMEQIGIYNLGYQIFGGLLSLMFILNTYYLPLVSQNVNNETIITDYLYRKRMIIFILGLFGIILIYIFTPFVFSLIYKDAYPGSSMILRILLIGSIFHLYNVFYIPVLNAFKEYKFIQITNVVHISLNVLLNILLIPVFGIFGAAIATVSSYFVKTIMWEVYFLLKYPKYSVVYSKLICLLRLHK